MSTMTNHAESSNNAGLSTLVEVLRLQASQQPQERAYTFLVDGEAQEVNMTFGELDQRARAIAALLQSRGTKTGERALLVYPPGLEFIAAFFGCLYAGVVAVPTYPPHPARLKRTLPRFQAIINDAQPSLVLTTSQVLQVAAGFLAEVAEVSTLRSIATDASLDASPGGWHSPEISGESTALLQYTSGSTATPKGVVVSHDNILENERILEHAFEHDDRTVIVGWLPVYHDMGLIGNVLHPIYLGVKCILMSPMAFLQRPIRWLQAISRYRGTTSGGPSFAYDLCVRKTGPEERATLDLSCWTLAFNGSEPVRNEVLTEFAEFFEPAGFRREAFYPCYGLAESTLFASGGVKASAPKCRTVAARELGQNNVKVLDSSSEGTVLVGCGRSQMNHEIIIVDPEAGTRCSANRIGEIWLSGPSTAQGYWNRPEETEETFRAYLADTQEGPFLRTGDLGFLHEGELYVTGRIKDLIIIRGKNHYPQDIEWSVQQSHPALRRNCCVAFSMEREGEEVLVVVAEVERRYRVGEGKRDARPSDDKEPSFVLDVDAVAESIRTIVADQHGLYVHSVLLVQAGCLPKTTSGKNQRHACRSAFLNDGLDVVGRSVADQPQVGGIEVGFTSEELASVELEERSQLVVASLREEIARVLRRSPVDLDPAAPLNGLALDSLMAIELSNRIGQRLGIAVPMTTLLEGLSVNEIAERALEALNSPVSGDRISLVRSDPDDKDQYPLSYGQQALWFLQKLTPESSAYNIAAAARVRASVDERALERALQVLVDRHACLRTRFSAPTGRPVQRVEQKTKVEIDSVDATTWSEELINNRMIEDAYRPFNLETDPLLRLKIFRCSGEDLRILLVVHHIVADFWSLAVLLDELGKIYAAERAGVAVQLVPLSLRYTDYVRWQRRSLAGPEGRRLREYWEGELGGELPDTNLPFDRPRPATQTYQGGSHSFRINADQADRIRELSGQEAVTVYMFLLATFNVLLHRYTGQDDILVGSPTAGRSQAELAGLVGYLVNPVVLRAKLGRSLSFKSFLRRLRKTVLKAFSYQDYPFPLLVEHLQPVRDPSRAPLFQVMFVLQKAHRLSDEGLSAFSLREEGARMDLWGLPLESIALEHRATPFDLTLMFAEGDGELRGSFEYNTDLFDRTTVIRMERHFQNVLEQVLARPQEMIADLGLMAKAERCQVLVEWNSTAVMRAKDVCIHDLFELQAAATPEAVALVHAGKELSYGDLNSRANRLGSYLRKRGVGPEVLVGIYLDRSLDMVVSLLGVLKAGGAYVPLDPKYPKRRIGLILENAAIRFLITHSHLKSSLPERSDTEVMCLDAERGSVEEERNLPKTARSDSLAYVIYTSGSTGTPKGVMIQHGSVVNFFVGMDERVGYKSTDVMLALTSISFDISVLELLWTLTRGVRVILLSEDAPRGLDTETKFVGTPGSMGFSLFYFANVDSDQGNDKYRLLREGVKFADKEGFEAVWTPERHFHEFGGLYPNPSVTSAALAAMSERVQIRAGSVVLPLHDPIRIAEEWSLIDNISQGRVGVSFASGWHMDDFVLSPDSFAARKEIMYRGIETVQKLWRGESIEVVNGAGEEIEVRVYPRPVQHSLPIWITAAGASDTFVKAGEIGANVLTHLLGQTIQDVEANIRLYRKARAENGHDPKCGRVTLMLHTFVGDKTEVVREKVRRPLKNYLRTSVGLIGKLTKSLDVSLDVESMSKDDLEALLDYAFQRYFETSGLFGTPERCLAMTKRLEGIGVNEVACLIDFGVDDDAVIASLPYLNIVRRAWSEARDESDYSLASEAKLRKASLLQCTPSMMRMLALRSENMGALKSLRALLLGGETLPPGLAEDMRLSLQGELLNMYGPTEATVWSASHKVNGVGNSVPIGGPIANTQIHILDRYLQPLPPGVPGELHIGGEGLARGYLGDAKLTAERFIPDPFSDKPGRRLYKTGDLARYLPNGNAQFLARIDNQIKIRGFRIELGDIEAALGEEESVGQAVVIARPESPSGDQLVAYVVPEQGHEVDVKQLRDFLKGTLPEYMVPAVFVVMEELPMTTNGKVNRRALPAQDGARPVFLQLEYVAPQNAVEQTIARVWQQALGVEKVGIHDNFFDLGGHSLLMAQVHSQLQDILGVELPLVKVLEYPTINALARFLNKKTQGIRSAKSSAERAQKQRAALRRHVPTKAPSKSVLMEEVRE